MLRKNRNKLSRLNAGIFGDSDKKVAVADDGDDEIYHRRDFGLQTASHFGYTLAFVIMKGQ
jgi:hypothetical protein